jgi:hypothetical protein
MNISEIVNLQEAHDNACKPPLAPRIPQWCVLSHAEI